MEEHELNKKNEERRIHRIKKHCQQNEMQILPSTSRGIQDFRFNYNHREESREEKIQMFAEMAREGKSKMQLDVSTKLLNQNDDRFFLQHDS